MNPIKFILKYKIKTALQVGYHYGWLKGYLTGFLGTQREELPEEIRNQQLAMNFYHRMLKLIEKIDGKVKEDRWK